MTAGLQRCDVALQDGKPGRRTSPAHEVRRAGWRKEILHREPEQGCRRNKLNRRGRKTRGGGDVAGPEAEGGVQAAGRRPPIMMVSVGIA